MINIYSYDALCNYIFDENHQSPKNNDIVFLQLENYPAFEQFCQTTSDSFTLVSPRSDLGICFQELNHPNNDLLKKSHLVDYEEIGKRRDAYCQITLGPTVTDLCYLSHKYSIKNYSGTHCTFQEVPKNVKVWYCTNLDVNHTKMTPIPFGIADGSEYLIEKYKTSPKTKLLYLNFQENTIERHYLNRTFKLTPWATVNKNLEREAYFEEMAQHKFILCPAGNGLDCYRTYEALYMGCIPIVKKSTFSQRLFANLPVVLISNFYNLNENMLNDIWESLQDVKFNLEELDLEYWKRTIR